LVLPVARGLLQCSSWLWFFVAQGWEVEVLSLSSWLAGLLATVLANTVLARVDGGGEGGEGGEGVPVILLITMLITIGMKEFFYWLVFLNSQLSLSHRFFTKIKVRVSSTGISLNIIILHNNNNIMIIILWYLASSTGRRSNHLCSSTLEKRAGKNTLGAPAEFKL